jgi:hypothetical protein
VVVVRTFDTCPFRARAKKGAEPIDQPKKRTKQEPRRKRKSNPRHHRKVPIRRRKTPQTRKPDGRHTLKDAVYRTGKPNCKMHTAKHGELRETKQFTETENPEQVRKSRFEPRKCSAQPNRQQGASTV